MSHAIGTHIPRLKLSLLHYTTRTVSNNTTHRLGSNLNKKALYKTQNGECSQIRETTVSISCDCDTKIKKNRYMKTTLDTGEDNDTGQLSYKRRGLRFTQ